MKAWFLLFFVSGAALADDAAMLRCRAVADVPSRARCYDAIPVPDAATVTVVGSAVPSAAAAPAAPSPAEMARSFGFETAAKHQPERLASLESSIAGAFDGWRPNQRIKLANGQVWQVSDDSEVYTAASMNAKVTLTRGALGAVFMEIDGVRRSPKVRRVE